MPRRPEMTWVPKKRMWRKVYRGKVYTVSVKQLREAGHQPQDDTKDGSRVAANAWWHQKEFELEAAARAAPRPPVPYEEVVAPLLDHLGHGRQHLEQLLDRPITQEDEVRRLCEGALMLFQLHVLKGEPLPEGFLEKLKPPAVAALDRLKGAAPAEPDRTVAAYVRRWQDTQRAKVAAGGMTAARFDNLDHCLRHFVNHVGADAAADGINEQTVESFYRHCQDQVARRRRDRDLGWSCLYARDVFRASRAFVRWLWESRVIELPRNLDSRAWVFAGTQSSVCTWTVEEFRTAVGAAPAPMKAALLLMANCGMTQVDVSDLLDAEVDWAAGTVTRKRSKTRGVENVPTVTYRLWPATLESLKRCRSGKERAILTRTGLPYVRTELRGGRFYKSDMLSSYYRRLHKRLGTRRPLKQLRKMGASLLATHPTYGRFAQHFLGHSPRTVADRHYIVPPQELFDEAVTWLGRQLGQVEP
jgi:hypothetical protein